MDDRAFLSVDISHSFSNKQPTTPLPGFKGGYDLYASQMHSTAPRNAVFIECDFIVKDDG